MSSHTTSKIFVIGGTGAQGIPIIRALVADKKYSVRFLSRDPASRRATLALALGVAGRFTATCGARCDTSAVAVRGRAAVVERRFRMCLVQCSSST